MLHTDAWTMQPRWAVQLANDIVQSEVLHDHVQHWDDRSSTFLLLHKDVNLRTQPPRHGIHCHLGQCFYQSDVFHVQHWDDWPPTFLLLHKDVNLRTQPPRHGNHCHLGQCLLPVRCLPWPVDTADHWKWDCRHLWILSGFWWVYQHQVWYERLFQDEISGSADQLWLVCEWVIRNVITQYESCFA